MDFHDLAACRRLARLWGREPVHGLINLMPLAAPVEPAQRALETVVAIMRPALVAGQGAVVCLATTPATAIAPVNAQGGGACAPGRCGLWRPSAAYGTVGPGARGAGHYGGHGGPGARPGPGGQRAAAGVFIRRTPAQPCGVVFSFAVRRAIRLTCAVAVLNPGRTKGWVR